MRCIHCKKKIPDDAFFCPYCGMIVGEESDEREDYPTVLWRPREIEEQIAKEECLRSNHHSDQKGNQQRSHNSTHAERAEWLSRAPEKNPRKKSNRYVGVIGIVAVVMIFLIVAIWLIFSTLDANEKRAREERQETLKAEEQKKREERKENLEKNKYSTKEDEDEDEEEDANDPKDETDNGEIEFSLVLAPVDLSEYYQLPVINASASSVINQEGTDNSAMKAVDGSEKSSWQEGVDGDGIGESIHLGVDQPRAVKYLSFKLGNWNSDKYYDGNNRPKELLITVGDVTQSVVFPDGKEEYWVELSGECETSEINLTIRSVYSGSQWDDTCIAEVSIYGKDILQ